MKCVGLNVTDQTKQRMKQHNINWSEYLRLCINKKLEFLEKQTGVWKIPVGKFGEEGVAVNSN